ncbi:hypothetical protein AX769_00870 [Frondihabitans sp. PAMC 28766]|nr:hypothetical protein AX769_00870 [Frondihabitans sp. PAMC 28766]
MDAPGAEPHLGAVVLAPRRPGFTRLSVIAAPLNPLDLLIASGGFHSARHESPYVPGSECVGVVLESERFEVGAVVYAECHASPELPGALAAEVVVPDDDLLVLPGEADPILSAAVGNSGVAAYLPLIDVARLEAGETVLVLGATGSVGRLALQIAHLHGAGRVIGIARDAEALQDLLRLGADAVVELRHGESAESLARRIGEVAPSVDVVLDGLYGVPLEAALQVCAPRARLVNIGNPTSATITLAAGLLRGKRITLSGFAGLHTPLRDKRPALTWLWEALRHGDLDVSVATILLEELPAAWRAQSNSPHTKYVVVPHQKPSRK